MFGCGFDTGGVASGGASIGSAGPQTATDDEEGDGSPEAGAATAADGEDDGDDAAATTADGPSGSDPTGDPTGSPTTDPSGDPSGEEAGSSSGVVDPTTGVVDPTTGPVDPTTGEPPPPDGTYPSCSGANVCADGTQDCLEFVDGFGNVVANICVPPCMGDGDCPAPDTGTAMPYCSDYSNFCRLSCEDGSTCPNGMTCYSLTDGSSRCAYML